MIFIISFPTVHIFISEIFFSATLLPLALQSIKHAIKNNIARYERSEVEPNIGMVATLAGILGVSVDELCSVGGTQTAPTSETSKSLAQLATIAAKLSEEDVALLVKVAKRLV